MARRRSMRSGVLLTLSIGVAAGACGGGAASTDDQHQHDASGHEPGGTTRDAGHRADDGTQHGGADDARHAADAGAWAPPTGHQPDREPHGGADDHPPDAGASPGSRDAGTPPAVVTNCDRRPCEEAITHLLDPTPEERERIASCCISADECGLSFTVEGMAGECFTPVGVAPNGGLD